MNSWRSSAAFGSYQFVLVQGDTTTRRHNFVTPSHSPWRYHNGLSGNFTGTASLHTFAERVPDETRFPNCRNCTAVIGSSKKSLTTIVSPVESRGRRAHRAREKAPHSRISIENKRSWRSSNNADHRKYDNANGAPSGKRWNDRRGDQQGSKPQWVTQNERLERLGIFGLAVLEGSEYERHEILEELARGKNIPTTTELNEVLTALCRARRMADAHSLMEILVNLPEKPRKQLIENVKTYTIMIDICGKSKQLAHAFSLFYGMQRRGLKPNAITFNSIIAACARNNEPELAFELFKEMEGTAVEPDKFTFGALIDCCAKTGEVDLAFDLAELMDRKGILKDPTIYSALMDACGRANQIDRAFSVYMDMKKAGVYPNLITFSLLIDTCANCRSPESVSKAFQIFGEIRHWGYPHANVIVYTALLNCCSKSGFPELGKQVLDSMIAQKVEPNAITFGAYIDGWSRAGLVDEAFNALRDMIKIHRCEPNAVLIGGLIDTARRTRQYHRAKRLWGVMVQFNVRISRIFYPALMAMAAKNGDIDVAIGIAYYVLGTDNLRRCETHSEDALARVLAHSIVYVKHVIDSTGNGEMRKTRQARMAVLYESTSITDEEYESADPERSFDICVSWGDARTRDGTSRRQIETQSPKRVKNSGARQAMIRGRESLQKCCSST